ncbi:hypothetical protein [uncultured Rikenella sp.]|nr:hypothetical protein [uncultured Rikenella sp.]
MNPQEDRATDKPLLQSTATEAQIGAVFDQWVSMAQGPGKPGLPEF